MAENELCGLDWRGDGIYTAEGITKLCEGLKGSAVTSLKCAAAPRVFAFVSAPADTLTPAHRCSLANNQICGLDYFGNGTYTAEGITKLCEALKESAVTSLKCATRPQSVCFCVSAR